MNEKGLIEDIGSNESMDAKYAGASFETDIDAKGKSVVPGFIDAHTHPVWAGDRVHEFAMKLSGKCYPFYVANDFRCYLYGHTQDGWRNWLYCNLL